LFFFVSVLRKYLYTTKHHVNYTDTMFNSLKLCIIEIIHVTNYELVSFS